MLKSKHLLVNLCSRSFSHKMIDSAKQAAASQAIDENVQVRAHLIESSR